VAAQRVDWKQGQPLHDARRLIFIDETWAKTNMIRLRGRAMRGQRLLAKVPHGHWKTTTLIAALGIEGIRCSTVVDGAVNGDVFESFVAQVLVPQLKPGDVVVLIPGGQPVQPQAAADPRTHRGRRRPPAVPAAVQPGPEPHRDGVLQGQATAAVAGLPDTPGVVGRDAVDPRSDHTKRRNQLLQALRVHATDGVGML
jgi:hypothetical protein